MKRLLGILAALLLLPCSALAQIATTYQLTDSGSAVHQVRGWTCQTSQLCLAYVPVDYTGSVFGVSANPFYVAPGAGVTFPVTGTVSCSNCSGSGVSANFGSAIGSAGTPGGFKDAGGLFQPFLGDANGIWVNIKAAAAIGVTGTFWQSTQPVSGTFWQSTQPVSAVSLPLPSGAATAANQATEITSLGTIATNSATQATAANQTAGNASLATIATNIMLPLPACSASPCGTTVGATLDQGIAQNVEQTAASNGAQVAFATDLTHKLISLPYANPENFLNGQITSAMTGTTSTALTGMGAQGSGVRVYATACTFSNTHATVGTMINLQDGSGGTVLWQAPAGPAYNGAAVVFPTPIKTTANNGLFAVNGTTGSSTFVSCTGYKGA